MDSVVFVHVFHVINRDERIIDSHNVDIGLVGGSAHHKTPDASEAVDSYLHGHGLVDVVGL